MRESVHEGKQIKEGDTVIFEGCNMFGDEIMGYESKDDISLTLEVFTKEGELYGKATTGEVYHLEKDLLNNYDLRSFKVVS